MSYHSLVDVLPSRASQTPDRTAYRFLEAGDVNGPAVTVSYSELDCHTRAIAADLQLRGFAGQRALLLYAPGLDFISGFLGCLAAGVIAVPAPLPEMQNFERSMRRLRQVIADADISVVLSSSALIEGITAPGPQTSELAALTWIATDEVPLEFAQSWSRPDIRAEAIAFLQYTSGSTSTPKGVMVTHGNLMHNQQAIAEVMHNSAAAETSPRGVVAVSWLPVFHDMGLIGPVLQTIYTGMTSVLFSPLHFLQDPRRWLTAVSTYQSHFSGAPNFAYEMCIRRASSEWLDTLDLSHWKVAFNGAEPVRAETIRRFYETFRQAGLQPGAVQPVYGLAEATLLVTGHPFGTAPTILPRPLAGEPHQEEGASEVVGVGIPPAGIDVAIAKLPECGTDTPVTECSEGEEGEIWVSGPSVAAGYWGDEQRTAADFGAHLADGRRDFLRTGDLGFVQDGELFVTGRHKDLLIIDGKNHYPQDIELTVERAHPAVRPGCIAAFSVDNGGAGEEPVVVAEARTSDVSEHAEIAQCLRRAVSSEHGLRLHAVVLIPPRTIHKTSSGKIQRRACRTAYLNGDLIDHTVMASVDTSAPTEPEVADQWTPEAVQAWTIDEVARRADTNAAQIDVDRPLSEFGLSSRGLVELLGALSETLGRSIDPSVLFEHPTISALANSLFVKDTQDGRAAASDSAPVRDDDPIAVVGIGCRLPGGVNSMDDLWDLVSEEKDAITGFPTDRGWRFDQDVSSDVPLPRGGGFLDAVADFDATLFRISPREAQAMDPQQRLMLEISWEALERAGIDPTSLAGSATGVYTGVTYSDYSTRFIGRMPVEAADYISDNGTSSVTSGRVSYVLGLEGPAVTIDTACSSSLVAVHTAAQAIRAGECSLALAGGVTVMSTPGAIEGFARKRGLSADGRCKAFSDSADGTAFAEGAGVLVLERLSDAVRNGHPVLALIAGSAINQDGASNGLTAPSGPAQERVIQQALDNAGLSADSVDVVEAHGTGTTLGDPIEARALISIYGRERPADRPLWLGSVKSNIGHTQAAAGVAGVIKMIAAIRHGQLPATLHVDTPSSRVDWATNSVSLLAEKQEWPADCRPRRAGVSSFGISGTNAHLILEQAPERPTPDVVKSPLAAIPVVLSAATPKALTAQADRLVEHLTENADLDPTDVAFSLVCSRAALAERAVVVGNDREQVIAGLRSVASETYSLDVMRGRARNLTRPVFVFSGHGAQWSGMAVELLECAPVFAEQLYECAEVLSEFVDWSLIDVLKGVSGAPELDRLDIVQPTLFAVMVSLARQWEELGVRPAAVIGHSQGEIVAAYMAGALSLRDAIALIARRGQALVPLSGQGAMATVALPKAQVESLLSRWSGRLEIGAINSPSSTVVSGDSDVIDEFLAYCSSEGTRAGKVGIRYASHSRHVENVRDSLTTAFSIRGKASDGPAFFSTVTGTRLSTELLDAEHWYRNVRDTVRFEDAIRAAYDQGFRTFIDVGPHPVLLPAVEESLADVDDQGRLYLGETIRREDGGITRFLKSAAQLHTAGGTTDWTGFFTGSGARRIDLPTYAFHRQRYWLEPTNTTSSAPDHEALFTLQWVPATLREIDSAVVTETAEAIEAGTRSVLFVRSDTAEDTSQHIDMVRSETLRVLAQVQDWLVTGAPDSALTVVTSGAVAVSANEDVADLVHAPIWGLLRAAQAEHPNRIILVDVDDWPDAPRAVAFAEAIGEPQLALRNGSPVVPRFQTAQRPTVADEIRFSPDGTVLITGGTGVLGAMLARHLVDVHGVRNLLLASRRGGDAEDATRLRADLTAMGAAVQIIACDIEDRESVAALLETIPDRHPLTAVIHLAGVAPHSAFGEHTEADIAAAFASKVDGAWHLHELTADIPLSAFVVYSSSSGLLGAARHAAYAAANSYLDALAQRRRKHGLVATALAWGAWSETSGVTSHLATRDWANLSLGGLRPLHSAEALELFDSAIAMNHPSTLIAPLDRDQMAQTGIIPTMFRQLVPSKPSAQKQSFVSSPFTTRLDGLTPAQQQQVALAVVRETAAAVLGYDDPTTLDAEIAFKDLGFDSLAAVEFRKLLQQSTGTPIDVAAVFNHPTPKQLAQHLLAVAMRRDTEIVHAPSHFPAGRLDDDPIAIVGIGCRYPGGVDSADSLWELVEAARDVITEVPADRGWDLDGIVAPGPTATDTFVPRGGFLDSVADFDAALFRISPREALAMDPQQRLMLEISWEALERAGIDPMSLAGSSTGVYTGVTYSDYAARYTRVPEEGADYISENGTISVTSGRVSYALGLEGPAVTVDTACSSSLVAVHLAAQAIRAGECSVALAGGVTVMSSPRPVEGLARKRGLSADGRCKAFADSADGTGFAEGAGVLVLERLSDAVRNGHPVLAVVAGSAVNQDGASNGLTAPSGPAQERVIRQALANAGVSPSDVDVVEAHGTGTALGDPIEARALMATYGQDRPHQRPLWLGSLKSNIGHTQAAAGVGGVIKMVAAMQRGILPATLHVETPSTHVDWSEGAVSLLATPQPWSSTNGPRRAGVSAFGVSGTNAHLILEQAPERQPLVTERAALPAVPFAVSGATATALAAQADRLATHLSENPDVDLTDVALSLITGRATLPERAVVVGGERDQVIAGLQSLAANPQGDSADVVRGRATMDGQPVFVFPGQGTHWAGMAVDLMETSPVFAEQLHECATVLSEFVEWSLIDVLHGSEDAPELDRLDVLHPVMFAVLVSLVRQWEAFGVRPAAVIGHSQGEIAAAYVVGALSLRDAIRLVALRARALQTLEGTGAMLAVALSADGVQEHLPSWERRLSIAVVNSPSSTVVSGDPEAIHELAEQLTSAGVRVTKIPAQAAGHSHHIEALRDEMERAFDQITPLSSETTFISTVTGELTSTSDLNPSYWWRNVRDTVQFEKAVHTAYEQGYRVFVEVSPHPALTLRVRECVDSLVAGGSDDILVVGSLRRGDGGLARMLKSAAELHVAGVEPDWTMLLRDAGAMRVDLPTYAFQRSRYWLEAGAPVGDAAGFQLATAHPMLAAAVPQPDGGSVVLTGRLSLQSHPWLADHRVWGSVVFPGTGYVELAVRAGDEVGATTLLDLVLQAPLLVPERQHVQLQVVVDEAETSGTYAVSIYSRPEQDGDRPWVLNAQGTVAAKHAGEQASDLTQWPPVGATSLDAETFYPRLAERGYAYGSTFQGVTAAWRRGRDVFAEVVLPAEAMRTAGEYGLHPALFDAALHTVAFAHEDDDRIVLPMEWTGVTLSAAGAGALRVRMTPIGTDAISLVAADHQGNPVLQVDSLVVRQVSPEQLAAADLRQHHPDLYRLSWQPVGALNTPETSSLRWDNWSHISAETPIPDVVVVESIPGTSAESVHAATRDMLKVLQDAFTRGRLGTTSTLLVVTRGAVSLPDEDVDDLAGAAVWGMVRSAQSENPGRIVLLDTDDSVDLAGVLACGEPQLVARAGQLYGARVEHVTVPSVSAGVDRSTLEGASVLVTGAPGGIGSLIARHLVTEYGVARLVLASRRGMAAPGADELHSDLVALGAKVDIVRCDVTNRDDLAEVLSDKSLSGIVHAAAVLHDVTLDSLTVDQLDAVLAPKVDAALLLHELTAGMDLSMFVLFSSAAGVLGNPGQANYAAANTFLDSLATHRVAHGLPAHSLAWGLWDLTSEDNLADTDRARWLRKGVHTLSPEDGLALFDAALSTDIPTVVPGRMDVGTFASAPHMARLFSGLARRRTQRAVAASASTANSAGPLLGTRIAGLSDEDAFDVVLEVVCGQTARVLGASAADLDRSGSFQQFGFDSLMAVELRNALRAATGLPLAITTIFDHPTPVALARYIRDELASTPQSNDPEPVDEMRIRQILASVPLDELRAAGVLDAVLSLGQGSGDVVEVPATCQYPATRDVMRLLRTAQQGIPSSAHTVAMAIRLGRNTTRVELENVLAGLAERHASLRTAFVPDTEHRTVLEVHRYPAAPLLRWTLVDDCTLPVVRAKLRALLEPSFDLTTTPLWRFELLQSEAGDQVLIYGAHHAVSDGQSMLLVAAEIDAALSGRLPALPASNRDVEALVEAQHGQDSADNSDVLSSWRDEFVGCQRLDLELAHARPASRTYEAGAYFLALPDGLFDQVTDRSRAVGVTPAAFFLGTLTVLLARRNHTNRFAMAVPVDTRIHSDTPTGIGYFGVPVPYPANVEDNEPVSEVLNRTAARLQRLLSKGAGFSDTLAVLAAEGVYRENAPLVEVYFNYIKAGVPFEDVEAVPVGPSHSDLDLMVTVMPDWGQVCFYYNLDIIDEASCAAFGAAYIALLDEVLSDPDLVALPSAHTPPAEVSLEDGEYQVAISASFALGNMPALCEAAFDGCKVVEAPYHQVLASLRDPAGVLSAPSTSVGVLLLRAIDLERFGPLDEGTWSELAHEIPLAVQALVERTRTPLIVGVLPSHKFESRHEIWKRKIITRLREVPGVALVEPLHWLDDPQVEQHFDDNTDQLAHLPFTTEFQASIALTLSDIVAAVHEPSPKVIAVDGDETLWGGVVDEIGTDHVALDGAHAALADRLLQWRAAGALLVLISNNDESAVRAVLDRADAALRAEHFTAISAGWEPKADRLEAIARNLQLGLDSFVFLDDNPVEVAAMRAALPQVLSITVPSADRLEHFLTRLWPMTPMATTVEDSARAAFYEHERQRDAVRAQTEFAEFLDRLQLDVRIEPLSVDTEVRAAQLIRRTNQFALRKVQDTELANWRRDGEVWTASASDRFGDYGLIGLLAIRVQDRTLRVDGWHLSCRALGRGVEERVLAWLADRAQQLECATVELSAQATERNVPARKILAALGGGDVDASELSAIATPEQLRSFRSWEQR